MYSYLRHFIFILVFLFSDALSASAFYYLGEKMPGLDSSWSAMEYQQVYQALKRVKEKHPDQLPKRGGEYTSSIFEKLISEENLQLLLRIQIPLELRREEARRISLELRELMKIYFDFSATQQSYGTEALGLMIYTLRVQETLFTLTTEFWLTLNPSDQKNAGRLEGLALTKKAASELSFSAIHYLSFAEQFQTKDLELYAFELTQYLPDLFIHLTPPDRQLLIQKIALIKDKATHANLRKALQQLEQILTQFNQEISTYNSQSTKLITP